MKRNVLGRLLAVVLAVAMVVSLFCSAGFSGRAKADTAVWTKTVAGLSTSIIKAPAAPADRDTLWTGSYVWYGKYEGTPVKYRVLAPKTTTYGGTTMLLNSERVLYKTEFDEDYVLNPGAKNLNEWKYSDVRAGLNGSAFLTKASGFTALEKVAIASSKVSGHKLNTGNFTDDWYGNYIGLTGEKVFLLDYEDVVNPKYGYSSDPGCELLDLNDDSFVEWYVAQNRIKKDSTGDISWWWMRSAYSNHVSRAGIVEVDGDVFSAGVDDHNNGGVSPAFNVNLSSVIFSSVVKGTAGKDNAEYKLTLADSNLKVGIQSGKTLTASGNKITVPYKITGNDASNATQVSVLILDKPYTAGNTNSAKIKYYGKLDTGVAAGFMTTGTGTFTLPSGLSITDWRNSKYYVYLLAEEVNDIHETDYASVPLRISGPDAPNINTQPVDTTVAVGSTAKFSVVAVGSGTLSYQWQCKAPSATTWSDSTQSGAKSATLSVSTNQNHHGYQYRCVVTATNGRKAISNAATLSIKPKITTQPASKTVEVGDTATFIVAATGKATLKYQWQCKAPGSSTWTNSTQTGNKTAKLLVTTNVNHHGYQYRCVITDGNGQKNYSNAATLSIKPKITTQPANMTVAPGTIVKLIVAAKGKATLKYQWQYKTPGSNTWKDSTQAGAKTAKLTIMTTPNHNGYQYRCVVTDGNSKSTESNAATLTVK